MHLQNLPIVTALINMRKNRRINVFNLTNLIRILLRGVNLFYSMKQVSIIKVSSEKYYDQMVDYFLS